MNKLVSFSLSLLPFCGEVCHHGIYNPQAWLFDNRTLHNHVFGKCWLPPCLLLCCGKLCQLPPFFLSILIYSCHCSFGEVCHYIFNRYDLLLVSSFLQVLYAEECETGTRSHTGFNREVSIICLSFFLTCSSDRQNIDIILNSLPSVFLVVCISGMHCSFTLCRWSWDSEHHWFIVIQTIITCNQLGDCFLY